MSAVAVVSAPQKTSKESSRTTIPRLGVGVPYYPELTEELVRTGAADFVEIKPESLALHGELDLNQMDQVRRLCGRLPVVVRRESFSPGSRANRAYLKLLVSFHRDLSFAWHSEPDSSSESSPDFTKVDFERRFGAAFLIDANQEIPLGSGSWRSLDLSALQMKSRAQDFDPFDAIDNMALNAVAQIRLNGEPRVWDLFEYVRPLCPNIGGVVVDAPHLGAIRLRSELGRARRVGARHLRRT